MNGRLTGTTFQQKLFSIPAHIDITDPHKLKTNSLLLSLCNRALISKGIDIQKTFGIDVGKTDFFGNSIPKGDAYEPGICEMK